MSVIRSKLGKIRSREYDRTISGLLLLGAVFSISLQVVAGQFNIQTLWVRETSQLFVLWIVYLLLARLEIENNHLRIEFFLTKMSGRIRTLVNSFIFVVHTLTTIVMIYAMGVVTAEYWDTGTATSSIPTPILFFSGIVGLLLLLYVFISRFFIIIRTKFTELDLSI